MRTLAAAVLFGLLLILIAGSTVSPPDVPVQAAESLTTFDSYPWVYLRQGVPVAGEEELVSLIIVGDVLPGRGVASQSDPLHMSADWLREADLALGNLESIVTTAKISNEQPPAIRLQSPVASVSMLADAGFDILGLANNHSFDGGYAGLQETVTNLENGGLEVIGISENGIVSEPLYQNVNGVRLAFLAFNLVRYPSSPVDCSEKNPCQVLPVQWDPALSLAAIRQARSAADAVIVSVHWGYEYHAAPDPYQEKAALTMLESGADLVVGHHPHFPQKVLPVGERVVAYSLGNFLFDQDQEMTGHGLALRALFDPAGLRAVQALPIHAGVEPSIIPVAEAGSWLPDLLPAEPRLAFKCSEPGCMSANSAPADVNGRFYSGQIDLTGDGLPETVRKEGERVVVYEQGTAAWRSPEAWRVMDVALGDPNDDGRFEIMLAIRQEDAEGYERSQPYIIGHRGGVYNLLWGGRAVNQPILELEVGDVDGNGVDELVVIESIDGGSAQVLSVWRWSGWTFSLVWRSKPGDYEDLLLIGDMEPEISVRRKTGEPYTSELR